MKNFYIQSKAGKFVYFDKINELVDFLGKTVIPESYGLTRAQYVQKLIDLGHGYDDAGGVTMTRALAESFNIGIVRGDKHIRTDVHEVIQFKDSNYGD